MPSDQGLAEFVVRVDGVLEDVRGGQAVAQEGVQQRGLRRRQWQRHVPIASVLVEKMLPRFDSSKCVRKIIKQKKKGIFVLKINSKINFVHSFFHTFSCLQPF